MIVKQLEVRGQLRQIFGYSTVSTHVEIHTNRHRSFIQTDTEYIAWVEVSHMYSMGALMGVEVPRIAWHGEMHPSH